MADNTSSAVEPIIIACRLDAMTENGSLYSAIRSRSLCNVSKRREILLVLTNTDLLDVDHPASIFIVISFNAEDHIDIGPRLVLCHSLGFKNFTWFVSGNSAVQFLCVSTGDGDGITSCSVAF